MFSRHVWLVPVLLLAAGAAQAGTILDNVSDSQYTSLAQQGVYASVGEFQWEYNGGSYLASGILINNHWVLTAAHVVADISGGEHLDDDVHDCREHIQRSGDAGQ